MREMFGGASSFRGTGLNGWNVSKVKNLFGIFQWDSKFTGDVSNWDTSSVTDFRQTFFGATMWNGDVSTWDVSAGLSFYETFGGGLQLFNSDLSAWVSEHVSQLHTVQSLISHPVGHAWVYHSGCFSCNNNPRDVSWSFKFQCKHRLLECLKS